MRRCPLAYSLCCCAALLVYALSAHAQDDVRERAVEHFQRGYRYLTEGSLDAALSELTLSRELLKTRGNTVNLAIVLARLERYDEALALYRELLTSFELEPVERRRVEREIEILSKRVGTLALECEPGARVYIDGRERGTTPLSEPLSVSAGSRVVRVIKAGRIPFEERVLVTGGRELRVEVELPELVERVVVHEPAAERPVARPAPVVPPTPERLRVAWGLELAGYAAPSLGGPLRASCGDDCDTAWALGFGFDVRGGVAFESGLELAATIGWLSVTTSYSGRDDSVDIGGAQSGKSDDDVRLSGVLVGVRGGITRGATPFWRLSLAAGGLFAKVRDDRTGRYSVEPAAGSPYETTLAAERSAGGNYLFLTPEATIGWRIGSELELGAGIGLLSLFALSTPRWPEDDGLVVTGGPSGSDLAFPDDDALTGSPLFLLSPRAVVSGAF